MSNKFKIIPAAPGWFVCEFMEAEGTLPDAFSYNPVIAWDMETEIDNGSRLHTPHPITAEVNSHPLMLKSPDGQFIVPCHCSYDNEADALQGFRHLKGLLKTEKNATRTDT